MKTCPRCGLTTETDLTCPVCGARLPLDFGSATTWRKVGLTILVPILVYLVMTAIFGPLR